MSSELETREQLFEVMEQIAEEREAAWPVVQELLARKPEELQDIEIDPSWRTAGFVRELSEEADKLWQSDPLRALPLEQLALVLAMSIPSESYPSPVPTWLEGVAWTEIGYVHRVQNANAASLQAFEAAETHFERNELLVHDTAANKLARAVGLALMRRVDEAPPLIQQSESILREFDDQRRLRMAQLTRALVNQKRGEIREACRIYEQLLSLRAGWPQDDLYNLGTLYNNLGRAYQDLSRYDEAVSALQQARGIYAEVGIPTDKPDWVLAGVLLATGEFTKASSILGRLRDSFLSKRMPQEAGEVALDIVEILIATDRYAEARALTEQVLKEFVEAGLNGSAITAIAYLRDLLPTAKEARRAVQHVRSHLQELRSEPARVFVPMDDEPG